MKHAFSRLLAAVLTLTLVLTLCACGNDSGTGEQGSGKLPASAPGDIAEPNGDLALPELQDISVPPVTQKALDDLEWLMDVAQMPTAAVAYLGYFDHPEDDYRWRLQECINSAPQVETQFPMLTTIAPENIIGTQGDLFCILLHSGAKMTVHPLEWQTPGEVLDVVKGDPIFRMEDPVPVLVFVNFSNNGNDPDLCIDITGSDGTELSWWPMIDQETGGAAVPGHNDYGDMLLDFTNLGDYGTQEELLAAEDIWMVPTEAGLANTSWMAFNGWRLDLALDTDGGESAVGGAAIYYTTEEDGEYCFYRYAQGTWWMDDEFLCLDVYNDIGTMVGGAFPVRVPLSGEMLYMAPGEDYSTPPFYAEFGEGYMLLRPLYDYVDYYPQD